MNTERHRRLQQIVSHAWVQGIVGSILLVSVFTEFLGVHHGLFAVGVWHVAQLTPNILQALERINKWLQR